MTSKPRIGVARSPYFDEIDAEVEVAFNEALQEIGNFSADVVEVELPDTPGAIQGPEVYVLHSKYFAESPEKYGRWMQERLTQAATIDQAAYSEARRQLHHLRRLRLADNFRPVRLHTRRSADRPADRQSEF
jgi:Asp-tRNA(Asn)/Glu-tRNA(Gln) amidotransferase A subunit family amidase